MCFYKVVSGAVRTYKLLSDGPRQIDAVHLPDDIFGLEADEEHRFGAEVVTATRLIDHRRELRGLVGDDGVLAREVVAAVMRGLERAQDHMMLLERKSAKERIATFLFSLSQRMSNGSSAPSSRLTRQAMGAGGSVLLAYRPVGTCWSRSRSRLNRPRPLYAIRLIASDSPAPLQGEAEVMTKWHRRDQPEAVSVLDLTRSAAPNRYSLRRRVLQRPRRSTALIRRSRIIPRKSGPARTFGIEPVQHVDRARCHNLVGSRLGEPVLAVDRREAELRWARSHRRGELWRVPLYLRDRGVRMSSRHRTA
ncbi:hypothetical protein LPC10_00830 [Methylorubrum sp. B1-46]|nr:hypothetical protein [Methylorubrum sp. B1-46]UGB28327.1 hypothetical protein LPC10_00830 [Methylorubrum sp. B1-46]